MVQIYDVGEATVIRAPDGRVHELHGPSALLARELLAFTLAPRTRAEIKAHVEELTGAPLGDSTVVDELLTLLESAEALIPAAKATAPRISQPRARLVLGLCGAVAAALAPGLVALLQRRGFELRICATDSALRFVRAEALDALCHAPVRSSMWPSDAELPVPHIDLARWADAVLIWPATATTIARLAAGDHSTLVSALALATRAPVVLVPSMNADMYAEPAVQRNLAQLVSDGVHVVHPGSGAELADDPARRRPSLGPTPPHAVVVALLDTALRLARARRRAGPPRTAEAWDELFRTRAEQELDWQSEVLDADLRERLAAEAGSGKRLLEIGTGLGVAAVAAAELGFFVVATDCSATALDRARERHGSSPVVWLRDDIAATQLHAEFDLVLDRGCLHLLDAEQARAYAEAVARLTRPGASLLIKTHDPSEGATRQTTPYDGARIEALLGAAFELESDSPSTLPGPREAPAARLFVLRRKLV